MEPGTLILIVGDFAYGRVIDDPYHFQGGVAVNTLASIVAGTVATGSGNIQITAGGSVSLDGSLASGDKHSGNVTVSAAVTPVVIPRTTNTHRFYRAIRCP